MNPISNHLILESLPGPFFILDDKFNFVFINKEAEDYFKRKKESLLNKNIWKELKIVNAEAYEKFLTAKNTKKNISYEEFNPQTGKYYLAQLCPMEKNLAVQLTDISVFKKRSNEKSKKIYFLETLLANAPVGIAFLDKNLRYTIVNNTLAEINGIPIEEHLGKTVKEIIPSIEKETTKKMKLVLKTGKPIIGTKMKVKIKPGNRARGYLEDLYPVYSYNKKIVGVGVLVRDISETEELQEKLQQQSRVLSTIISTSNDQIIMYDNNFRFIFINKLAEKAIGIKNEEVVGKNPEELGLPQNAIERLGNELKIVSNTQKPVFGERKYKLQNGEEKYIGYSLNPIVFNNKVESVVVHRHDITERKKFEEALKRSEEKFRKLFESDTIGILITDQSGNIYEANDEFLKIIGFTRSELESGKLNWQNLTTPEYKEISNQLLADVLTNKKNFLVEKEYFRKDRTRVPVVVGGVLLDEKSKQILTFVLDVTKRKKAEMELENAKHQLEAILQNVADGINAYDKDGNLLFTNDTAAIFSGFDSSKDMIENKKKQIKKSKRFELRDKLGNIYQPRKFLSEDVFRDGLSKDTEVQSYDKIKNKNYWLRIKSNPVLDKFKNAKMVVNIISDITQSKEIEKRKDEFISMASHELKTPITSIKLFIEILQKTINQGNTEKASKYLFRINEEVDKLTELVNDLLDISKIEAGRLEFRKEMFSLEKLIKETIQIMKSTTSHRIVLKGAVKKNVYADKNRISQVLINLITNAIKYSPQANKINMGIKTTENEVTVSIKDYGIGISKENQKKIFNRFFSIYNKKWETLPGLGLGLYISSEIIKRHGGKIWVDSNPGKGSTFYFSLPFFEEQKHLI